MYFGGRSPAKSPVTVRRERDGREGERKKKRKKKSACLSRSKKKSPGINVPRGKPDSSPVRHDHCLQKKKKKRCLKTFQNISFITLNKKIVELEC